MNKNLTIIATMTPAVFETGLPQVLEQIQKEARSRVLDVQTVNGRKEIASLAYQIARSKTLIDDTLKGLKEEWKKKVDAIDAKRKLARDTLDELQEEIRKPLTDWETVEKDRIEGIQSRIHFMRELPRSVALDTLANITDALNEITGTVIDDTFEEFTEEAKKERETALLQLEALHSRKKAQEEEEARLEAEREAQAEQERAAREEAIRQEEREAAAKRADALVRKAEEDAKAEADKVLAEHNRKQAEAAEEARLEKEREEFEKEEAEEEERKRQADATHRGKILSEAAEALAVAIEDIADANGIPYLTLRKLVDRIAEGKIPHVTIQF